MEFDIHGERDERGALDNLPIQVQCSFDDDGDDDNSDDDDYNGDNDECLDGFPTVPARLTRIKGSITIFAKNRKGEPIQIGTRTMDVLEKHTEWRCPVANMIISSGCLMNVEWIDGWRRN